MTLRGGSGRRPTQLATDLSRPVRPIEEVLAFVAPRAQWWRQLPARAALVGAIDTEQQTFWAWDRRRWLAVIERTDSTCASL